jgi:guanine nucleotide-binding protein G(i) subunit alpha
MGNCFSSNQEKEAKERSYAIDKQIEEDSRKLKRECKILLLGEWKHKNNLIVTPSSRLLYSSQAPANRANRQS